MPRPTLIVLLSLGAGLAGVDARAAAPRVPATPVRTRLLDDARDGQLDEHTPLEAALIAAGREDAASLRHYERCWNRLVSQAEVPPAAPPRERARAALAWMHRRLLTGDYRVDCFDIAETLDQGSYNCVTATVLYACLARQFGFEISVWASPTHVHGRLEPRGPRIEVTSPHWQPPADRGVSLRRLNRGQLLARVLYNRGIHQLQQDRFAAAYRCFLDSHTLDPAEPAVRRNLATTLNNWALRESQRGRHEQAVDLLLDGLQHDPTLPHLLNNDLHVHQQWIKQLCERRKYEEALGRLEQAHRRRPEARLFDQGRVVVLRMWVRDLERAGRSAEARQLLESAGSRFPDHAELADDLAVLRSAASP